MSSFSLREVAWKETAILNGARSIAASVVWMSVFLFMYNTVSLGFLTLPFYYLLLFAPIGVVCSYLARVIPFIGLISIALAIVIVVGDPILCLIAMLKPGIIPVDHYPPFNFVLVIYVLKG